ncbi:hypothetical protein AX15_007403 [Amanita polypyramis BW_CC]|nr:hypothetical protein AX15_007403 [Amanita polypyramis BW_CC]
MEAISHAGTVIGILATDGVVLAAEKRVTGKLLDLSGAKEGGYGGSGEKIFLLNSNVIGGVAGLTADANSLINYARTAAQRHLLNYNEDIPVELLAQRMCDLKQGYTQFGGLRPFGVSLLYAGYDAHYQFQLYHSDPSGNYSGWKATCIGANIGTAQSLLKQEYKDEITVKEAISLVLKTMSKTMDSTTLGSEKLEFAVLALDPKTKKPGAKIYKPAEIDALLVSEGLMKQDEDTEMKTVAEIKSHCQKIFWTHVVREEHKQEEKHRDAVEECAEEASYGRNTYQSRTADRLAEFREQLLRAFLIAIAILSSGTRIPRSPASRSPGPAASLVESNPYIHHVSEIPNTHVTDSEENEGENPESEREDRREDFQKHDLNDYEGEVAETDEDC